MRGPTRVTGGIGCCVHSGGSTAARSAASNVTTIGSVLFTTYSFAFEVTSILILVAMVGAVVIAGKPRSEH